MSFFNTVYIECEFCSCRNRRNSSPPQSGTARAHRLPEEHGGQVLVDRNEEPERVEEQSRPRAGKHPEQLRSDGETHERGRLQVGRQRVDGLQGHLHQDDGLHQELRLGKRRILT